MVKSKLSDEEINTVAFYATGNDIDGLVKYLNGVLYEKGKGTDLCARPIAFRSEKDMEHFCFASGYLKKVYEFMNNTGAQFRAYKTIEKTKEYVEQLLKEIDRFFEKEKT